MEASTGPASPERQPSHKVVSALLATMDDLSARKAAPRPRQDDPQQNMRMLSRLAQESPNVVLRLDAAGTVLYSNPAGARFLAACGAVEGHGVPAPWAELARETCEFGMVRSEEMEVGDALYDVTLAPVPEDGYVNVYAADITRRRRAENAAREAGEKLLRSLEQTIAMVSRAVEKRDPSTSGHQLRVAAIAVAIGREMGLAPQRIEGLRLGATIHDIGKLHTPAELLTKPGKLMALEIELIRQHPLTGYEIVKDVDFPWPVAQMVLQHHERMDGTGYPHGLKGEEILLESRILAVADVVDGLSTHRPYRPALGLETALQEIERMRGRWLDAQAVDACLRLFRERGFQLPA
ncbi:HD-GYP domain-containing protein [Ramlibacter sp. AN1133]|uniref:HD-GYP domain-containing protein n=1 Tax=Ramlibacter sp. AN1133 TaxID=3133429 RepID=UPI0030BA5301